MNWMECMNELISVIMSAYNESYAELERSIGSILAQTYSNIELIIVNDNHNNIEYSIKFRFRQECMKE